MECSRNQVKDVVLAATLTYILSNNEPTTT